MSLHGSEEPEVDAIGFAMRLMACSRRRSSRSMLITRRVRAFSFWNGMLKDSRFTSSGHSRGTDFTGCARDGLQAGSEEMGRDVAKETNMSRRSTTRLVREGDLVAEVGVTLLESEGGWTPYWSLEDSYKLDDVRDALRAGDVARAAKVADRVYRLTPVQA